MTREKIDKLIAETARLIEQTLEALKTLEPFDERAIAEFEYLAARFEVIAKHRKKGRPP